jgi:hypothetical protein
MNVAEGRLDRRRRFGLSIAMIESRIVVMIAVVFALGACGKESKLCHDRQNRAKDNLNGLHGAETAFREKNGKFAGSLDQLGYTAPEPNDYDLKIESASATTYTATATGKGPAKGDVWKIDQLGNPIVGVDGCK